MRMCGFFAMVFPQLLFTKRPLTIKADNYKSCGKLVRSIGLSQAQSLGISNNGKAIRFDEHYIDHAKTHCEAI